MVQIVQLDVGGFVQALRRHIRHACPGDDDGVQVRAGAEFLGSGTAVYQNFKLSRVGQIANGKLHVGVELALQNRQILCRGWSRKMNMNHSHVHYCRSEAGGYQLCLPNRESHRLPRPAMNGYPLF